ncbi:MAG TPA: hypothetical protein VOA80_10490 [Thermoanaerobaculia bacterium]|nr:hypothetical protein [Thermoanaerobaculia bacterium]
MIADKETIYLDVNIQHSSVTLSHLAVTARAAYVVHVECTNTLFRRVFQLRGAIDRIAIRADQLNDLVEVNVFAVATQDISGYVVEGAHVDYEGSAFEVRKADMLALGEGRVFVVESSFDVLGRVGSIMQIESAAEEGDVPMRLDFNGEKIRIILSREDFKEYKLLRHDEALSTVITTSIVLPALVEALHYIEDESGADEADALGSLRWHRILNRRIEAMKLADETDKLTQAQKLLELPIRRALVTAHNMAEASA